METDPRYRAARRVHGGYGVWSGSVLIAVTDYLPWAERIAAALNEMEEDRDAEKQRPRDVRGGAH